MYISHIWGDVWQETDENLRLKEVCADGSVSTGVISRMMVVLTGPSDIAKELRMTRKAAHGLSH
jgi:hypothetical protein